MWTMGHADEAQIGVPNPQDNIMTCARVITHENWFKPNVIGIKGVSEGLIEHTAPTRQLYFSIQRSYNGTVYNKTQIASAVVSTMCTGILGLP